MCNFYRLDFIKGVAPWRMQNALPWICFNFQDYHYMKWEIYGEKHEMQNQNHLDIYMNLIWNHFQE